MKKVLIVIASIALTLFFSTYSSAWAGTDEDLQFAEALFGRGWYDWALEVTTDLVETSRNPFLLRGYAAETQVAVLRKWGRETDDQEKIDRAEALTARYEREFSNHPAWGGWPAKFAKLDRLRQKAEDLAKKADPEVEPNPEKRKEYMAAAVKLFEEIGTKYEELISKLRLEVAKYPPKMQWPAMRISMSEQQKLLEVVWFRDLSEYLYATSFIYYAKVVPKGMKEEIIKRGLAKFIRFIDGEPENEKDSDPPAKGQKGPQEPDPRDTYKMLSYLAEIGIGQSFMELGDYKEATVHFEYMVQAELPRGVPPEESEIDLGKLVDIRLQAFYFDGLTYNLWNKPKDAEGILHEMLNMSGKPIQPERLDILKYWQEQKRPEVALMPNVREHPYGKMAAFQLAKAFTSQGRYSEGIDEAYKIFAIEQASRRGGQISPLEVTAARTIADLAEQVSKIKFPIGPAFALAKGYYYKQDWGKAIYAFKKVYGSPGTPDEVREYAPKALFELGKLLYGEERYDEAAIAFAEICQQFKNFVQIGQSARLLQQCARKARQAARKSGRYGKFDEEQYKDRNKIAQDTVPESREKWREVLRRAGELSTVERNFELAAEKYGEIPKTYKDVGADNEPVISRVPFYAQARSHVGYCYYRLFERKRKSDPKKAMEHIQEAISILEDALDEAAQAEDVATEIFARYYLGKCLTEDVWKGKDAKDKVNKALKYLEDFRDRFPKQRQSKKYADKYAADVFATRAFAYYKLKNYNKTHAEFVALEKKFKEDQARTLGQLRGKKAEEAKKALKRTRAIIIPTSIVLYERMKKQGDILAKESEELAQPYYDRAAYYVYAWYKASGDKLKAEELLWAGSALTETKSYEHAVEVLEKFFDKLPESSKQTKKQKKNAVYAKILLAESMFGMRDFKGAAALFEVLRRMVACERCGYSKILSLEEFDKEMELCPKCKDKKIKLVKIHDIALPIQEGSAKSHMAIFMESKKKDFKALNMAQDVYQRILKRLKPDPTKLEAMRKYYEVLYNIVLCWYYKRDYGRIVGDLKIMILLSHHEANPENPTDEDWKRTIPVQPWRDKVRELFEIAKKALKKKKGK